MNKFKVQFLQLKAILYHLLILKIKTFLIFLSLCTYKSPRSKAIFLLRNQNEIKRKNWRPHVYSFELKRAKLQRNMEKP